VSESAVPSLRAIFEERRPAVQQSLPPRPTIREALPVIHDLLAQLHQRIIAEPAITTTPAADATAADPTAADATAADPAAVEAERRAEAVDAERRAEQLRQVHELLVAAVVGALGAVHGPPVAPPDGAEGRRFGPLRVWVDPDWRRPPDFPPAPWTADRPAYLPVPPSLVDWPALLDQLASTLEAADRLLAAAVPAPPRQVRAPWASDPELIQLFQDLLAAGVTGDGTLALDHIRRLRQTLWLSHDIDTVEFSEDRRDWFGRPIRGRDPGDRRYLTTRPALVSRVGDRRLLARGEFRAPATDRAAAPAIEHPAGPGAPARPGDPDQFGRAGG
jgi:hypothetical protein